MRHGRKIRRIGLHQQTIQRDFARYLAQCLGVTKRDNSRKRNIKTQIQGGLGRVPAFRKAVHHTTDRIRSLFALDANRILRVLACVNDERFAGCARGTDMATKTFLLPSHIALDAEIIKTGLADGDDAGIAGQAH